jgi:predicted nucleic acid-binding protein
VIVLDTNVVSEAMKLAPAPRVMAWLGAQALQDLATTAINLAEIHYGLRRLPAGRRRDDLRARFDTFMAHGFGDRILPFDASAADAYAEIVTARQIEAFDAMIAAVARVRGAMVATRDVADFEDCGLSVLNPWRS